MAMGGVSAVGWSLAGLAIFVSVWTLMMVAMMFPASAPMILTFSAIQARKRAARPYVPVSVFTASYVLVWALFGVVAFGFAAGLDRLAERSHLLMTSWPRIAGGLIVAVGVYQLTPLKDTCLSECRSPVSFLPSTVPAKLLSIFRSPNSTAVLKLIWSPSRATLSIAIEP